MKDWHERLKDFLEANFHELLLPCASPEEQYEQAERIYDLLKKFMDKEKRPNVFPFNEIQILEVFDAFLGQPTISVNYPENVALTDDDGELFCIGEDFPYS